MRCFLSGLESNESSLNLAVCFFFKIWFLGAPFADDLNTLFFLSLLPN